MKKSLVIIFACEAFLTSCSQRYIQPQQVYTFEKSITVHKNREEVWSAAYLYISQNYKIKNAMKQEGLIVASGHARKFAGLDCGTIGRHQPLIDVDYEFSVSITELEKSKSIVSVNLEGKSLATAYRKFMFIPLGRRSTNVSCDSTGLVEKNIFSALRSL